MKSENKYFIFDRPIDSVKYYVKYILCIVLNIFYKIMATIVRPSKIERKKYYSTICAIFKNEAPYFKEWLEFHKIIGIEHFYLYNNLSNDNYMDVLSPYIEDGIVTLIDWPFPQSQMKAYADCAERFSEEANWIGFVDLDEFIVPNTRDNINDILKTFEKNRPAVIIYWRLFGTSGIIDRDLDRLVTESFHFCWRKYTNIGKFFFNTAYNYAKDLPANMYPHYKKAKFHNIILPPVNIFNQFIFFNINRATSELPPMQINHYFTKSYAEYAHKKTRGDVFHEMSPYDEDYFYWHEMKCQSADYHIQKYMIKLKKAMGK